MATGPLVWPGSGLQERSLRQDPETTHSAHVVPKRETRAALKPMPYCSLLPFVQHLHFALEALTQRVTRTSLPPSPASTRYFSQDSLPPGCLATHPCSPCPWLCPPGNGGDPLTARLCPALSPRPQSPCLTKGTHSKECTAE